MGLGLKMGLWCREEEDEGMSWGRAISAVFGRRRRRESKVAMLPWTFVLCGARECDCD